MALRLNGSTSGFTALDAPATAGSNTLVLPTGNGTARQTMMTDGAGALSFQWDAGSLFYRLNADLAGANVSTAQNVFGVGVTLAGSTVYAFEALCILSKTSGTTSHTVAVGFAGTATTNNILYIINGTLTGSATNTNDGSPNTCNAINTAASTVTSVAISTATSSFRARLFGTVSINAGGTFIPQYTLSAAPGGAYSTVAGSYIKFTPIGAAGSASSQGTWS